jgi:putative tryptophan/tyrosine transport system substrate-binding protein
MKRRQFIGLLGGAAAWPVAARGQRGPSPVVGFVSSAEATASYGAAFRRGLNETGYVEGQNLTVEYHWLEGKNDPVPALVDDLVRRRVAVIATPGSTAAALAAKAATATIPIVFGIGPDPVQLGLVASLNRPGGNVTGAVSLNEDVGSKRLELLHELAPAVSVVALLVNPTNLAVTEATTRDAQAAAGALALQLHVLRASTAEEIDAAFESVRQLRAGALVIATDGFFLNQSEQLAALAGRYAVPAISPYRELPTAGGLMSYGGSLSDMYRLVGVYTGRILKGEKPADLPVQQATTVELVVNMKTARALGITFPLPLLGRADEVIE